MPPRMLLRPALRSVTIPRRHVADTPAPPSVCLFCSLAPAASARHSKRKRASHTRHSSAVAASPIAPSAISTSQNARKDLEDALIELQKHAVNYVNLSRLQLAVNGLRQKPGNEAIRVAVLGMSSASDSGATVKKVLRLLLADPLKDREAWEDKVEEHPLTQPMLVRVGPEEVQVPGTISISRNELLSEINISSATLNGHNLELLLMESNPLLPSQQSTTSITDFEESVLVPIIDIPTSSTGRNTSVTTPVHAAIVVANGIMGAASVASLASVSDDGVISAVVDLPDYKPQDGSELPFIPIDSAAATRGVEAFRKDIKKAVEYEHLWFQSNLSKISDWLAFHTASTADGSTKAPVRTLISSVLSNATVAVQSEETSNVGSVPMMQSSPSSTSDSLQRYLDDWAQTAHKELQDQLDSAFASRRWRKLGWWKLFWRVDDVGYLTTDILNQRYLPNAERSAIFLAGRMKEAGVSLIQYRPSETIATITPASSSGSAWPTNIPQSRQYLQTETIPALQAAAQRLVMQTLSTSSLTSALGALVYFGTLTTSIYEAGAVAALGIVWSLRRLQTKWENARFFWEGEVREEGRKAVRGVEGVIAQALALKNGMKVDSAQLRPEDQGAKQRQEARELIKRAEDALQRLK